MTDEAIFRREGEAFVPGADATGPWGADRLHGGPVLGLLARAIERAAEDRELVVTRLTCDLFRPVPVAPLSVRVDILRRSSRLCLLQSGLFAAGSEVSRATALLLRASESEPIANPMPTPQGPADLPTDSLLRGMAAEGVAIPPGFHTRVQTRWVPRTDAEPVAIWFRLPVPLVAGERISPLQSACALSDFANAVASIAQRARGAAPAAYINADATLYLSRTPEGDWFCLQELGAQGERGISVAEVLLHDARGLVGRITQSRLANRLR